MKAPTKVISLTLPYPPLTNNLYFDVVRAGRAFRVPTTKLKAFKESVAKICSQERIEPILGDVAMSVKVFRPQRSGDIDGTFKALIDSLQGIAYLNDKQLVWFHAERFEDKFQPRAEVQIWARSLL